MDSREDSDGCKIQLPPPMPLLLQSTTANDSSIVDQKMRSSSVSSSSSSPTGARASSSDINDDSVCCSASNCSGGSKSLRVIGDSGVNSSDDCGSLNAADQANSKMSQSSSAQRLSAIASPQTPPPPLLLMSSPSGTPTKQPRPLNMRPVSPALSQSSFGMEPKFQILTDISTATATATSQQRQNEDFLSQQQQQQLLLPHFISNNVLPQRYFASGTNPRSVRASTPTTVRKIINPSLLVSVSHQQFPQQQQQQQMYIDPSTGMPVYLAAAPQEPQTLPRHHVVRIVESEDAMERRHHRDQRRAASSDDDDTSSSEDDDDDSRIFSNSLRRGRSAFRRELQQKTQQSSIEYFQPRRVSGHQLSTIPEQEQVESSVTVTTGNSSLITNVSKVVAYVYVLLLCSLSIAFLFGNDERNDNISPLTALECFSHFLFVGSLIVAAILAYRLFITTTSSSSNSESNDEPSNHRLIGNNNRRRRRGKSENNHKQYDIIDTENGRITVVPAVRDDRRRNEKPAENRFLRRFERLTLASLCIVATFYHGACFAVALNQAVGVFSGQTDNLVSIAANATNASLHCSEPEFVKHQAVSTTLLHFWQLLLAPIVGYLLIASDSQIFRPKFKSLAIGIAHLLGTVLHALFSNQKFGSMNCSFDSPRSNFDAANIPFKILEDLKPLGFHLTLLSGTFMAAMLLRLLFRNSKVNRTVDSLHRNSLSPNYSWSRLSAITVGSLLTTVAVVWNIAIIVSQFSVKMTRQQGGIFVMVVGSSSPSLIENTNGGHLSTMLSVAGDGITTGILAISMALTVFCAAVAYFKSVDSTETSIANMKRNSRNPEFASFLLVSSAAVLLLHFSDLLKWTTESTSLPSPAINIWLCYSQLIHAFIQTITCVAVSSSSSLHRNSVRSLYLLNAFANLSLFLTATLKTFGSSPTSAYCPVVATMNSAYYLTAAFILLRLAR